MRARGLARGLRRPRRSSGQRVSQEELTIGQVDRNQVEGWTVAGCERGTSEQGKGLVRGSAKQFRRHGNEELVDEVTRDQGVIETGPAFDHKGLDTTLGFDGPQGHLEVDGTSGVRRRSYHRRELAQPFDNPLGSRIGEQDQDFLAPLEDKVFVRRSVVLPIPAAFPSMAVLPSTEVTVLMITYGLAASRCPVGGRSRSS